MYILNTANILYLNKGIAPPAFFHIEKRLLEHHGVYDVKNLVS